MEDIGFHSCLPMAREDLSVPTLEAGTSVYYLRR